MRQVALVASERGEFAGLLRRFGKGSPVDSPLRYARRVGDGEIEWLLFADGQGARAAARACARIPASKNLIAVGSIGYCGGTRAGQRVGDVLLAEAVEDRQSGERFSCWHPDEERSIDELPIGEQDGPAAEGPRLMRGSVLTVDRVIRLASEKRAIGETGMDAVEMEAAAVARAVADLRVAGAGVPFFCLKAISDTCEEDLAFDFDRARRSDGSVRIGSILAQSLYRPWYRLPRLGRLAKAAKLASENLGAALSALFAAKGDNRTGYHGDS